MSLCFGQEDVPGPGWASGTSSWSSGGCEKTSYGQSPAAISLRYLKIFSLLLALMVFLECIMKV